MKIYVDAKAIEQLKNPDCLSMQATIFRKGGEVNGIEAIPFELVPHTIRKINYYPTREEIMRNNPAA